MSTSEIEQNAARAAKFAVELNSIWKGVDLSIYPPISARDITAKASFEGETSVKQGIEADAAVRRDAPKGTQLLSMEQFLPDSAPSSSYGCGDGKNGFDSAEKVKHSYGDALHLPYSCNSVGLNHNNDYIYH